MLSNGMVDEQELGMLQTCHLGVLNELANVDHNMDTETTSALYRLASKCKL